MKTLIVLTMSLLTAIFLLLGYQKIFPGEVLLESGETEN